MDIKAGNPYPSGALSNFARRPFIFRGIPVESMEGFLQGLKQKSPDAQKHLFSMFGVAAKRAGKHLNWHRTQTLWFQGQPIKRDSQEYQDLLDEAYAAMFDQNAGARKALLDTQDAVLKHSIGRTSQSETVLTRTEFCSRLMKNRERLRALKFVEL